MKANVPSDVLSFETAQWLNEVGFTKQGRTTGYATGQYEVIIESPERSVRSDYHNTEIGEFINKDDVSVKKNFTKSIAAPTTDEALEYINKSGLLSISPALSENHPFFRTLMCKAVILSESKPGENMIEAAKNLFADKQFRAAFETRYNKVMGIDKSQFAYRQ